MSLPGSAVRVVSLLHAASSRKSRRNAVIFAAFSGVQLLHRQRGDPDFPAGDIAFLRALTPHVAEGLRTALLLADDASVIATTPGAADWLAELSDWPRREEAPQAVRAVAARLWVLERAGTPSRR